jgi:Protein of unknown function (DUF2568)
VALRFLLELCALVALGYWGFQTGQGLLPKIGLGIGVPLLTVVVWAMFFAPNAVVHLPEPVSFVLGLAILLLAVVTLAAAGQPTLAAAIRTLFDLNNEGDTYKLLALGVFLGAAALLIFRTHALPRWLGLVGWTGSPLQALWE